MAPHSKPPKLIQRATLDDARRRWKNKSNSLLNVSEVITVHLHKLNSESIQIKSRCCHCNWHAAASASQCSVFEFRSYYILLWWCYKFGQKPEMTNNCDSSRQSSALVSLNALRENCECLRVRSPACMQLEPTDGPTDGRWIDNPPAGSPVGRIVRQSKCPLSCCRMTTTT